ncbi:MAG TPA: serine hydrolase domain-containing protein [Bacteroidota bacterium]|nr:serine hydrolase domain-containing protein [Bacteroidota bacterium]
MKRGLGLFSILLFLALCFCAFSQNNVPVRNRLSDEQIQALVRESRQNIRSVLARELHLPGMAVALVSREGILWAEGFGYRDKSRTTAVDTNTIFGILSVSKPVTVTGLMIAVQEGLLDLDAPIRTYIPDLTVQSRFGGDPFSNITLRHLISMTSGLTHDAPLGNNSDAFSPSYAEHIRSFAQTWMRFRTGERMEYSGLGTELAALCLERVLHRPFTEYVQEKLFAPLGMNRSMYDIRAIVRDTNKAAGNNKNIPSLPVEIPMLAPAGVYSSVTDIARFVQFHLDGGRAKGRPLLREELVTLMGTIPFPVEGQISGYGQGLWVRQYHLDGEEIRSLEHGGGGFGFLSQMKWLPDLGYGVVVLTNSSDQDYGQEAIAEDVLARIIENLTGRKTAEPSDWLARHTPSATVDPGYLPIGLEGRYNGTSDDMVFLIRNGRFGFASGNSFEPMTPISRLEFASRRYLYRFVCMKDGTPISVVRPYDGTTWHLSEGIATPRGPEKKEWIGYVGSYVRKRFGVGEKFYNVSLRNGWLHFEGGGQDFRLTEYLPGLFFTPDGEAVDFRGATPTYRNIKLAKTCG